MSIMIHKKSKQLTKKEDFAIQLYKNDCLIKIHMI